MNWVVCVALITLGIVRDMANKFSLNKAMELTLNVFKMS